MTEQEILEIERLAVLSAENYGGPANMIDYDTGRFIVKDGKITEFGIELLSSGE